MAAAGNSANAASADQAAGEVVRVTIPAATMRKTYASATATLTFWSCMPGEYRPGG